MPCLTNWLGLDKLNLKWKGGLNFKVFRKRKYFIRALGY